MKKVIRIARLLAGFVTTVIVCCYGTVYVTVRSLFETIELICAEFNFFTKENQEITKKIW